MPRNLDHRIEVVAPVEDRRLREELTSTFDTLMQDNQRAWTLGPDGSWTRLTPNGDRPRATHDVLMRRAAMRVKRSSRANG